MKALDLRSGDWFGKNDVYVQAYAAPTGVLININKALPEPVMEIVLPVGQFNIPFSFQLPSDLPSSMVSVSKSDYVAYSVYAHIDIAWKVDPSTRKFFTVMQHHNPTLYSTPTERFDDHYHIYPTLCCTCSCFGDRGRLLTKLSIDRSAYAPGEQAILHLEINSDWVGLSTNLLSMTCTFDQVVECWADNISMPYRRPLTQPYIINMLPTHASAISPSSSNTAGFHIVRDIPVTIPIAPPSYMGGLGKEGNSMGEIARNHAKTSRDPLTWGYEISVSLRIVLPGFGCANEDTVVYRIPVVLTAVPKAIFETIQTGGSLFPPSNIHPNNDLSTTMVPPTPVAFAVNPSFDLTHPTSSSLQRPPLVVNTSMVPSSNSQSLQPQQQIQPQQQQLQPSALFVTTPYVVPLSPAAPNTGYAVPVSPAWSVSTAYPVNTPVLQSTVNIGQILNVEQQPSLHSSEMAQGNIVGIAAPVMNLNTQFEASLQAPTSEIPTQQQRPQDMGSLLLSQGLELVSGNTKQVIKDEEEDCTVENEIDLMYCPLYFKVK